MTVSQYFVYKRPIAWTLLFATLTGGFAAFRSMPQRQDPVIQIRLGLVSGRVRARDPARNLPCPVDESAPSQ